MNARARHAVVINVSINVAIMNVCVPVDLVENNVNFHRTIVKIITARTEQRVSMERGITRVIVPMVTGVIYVK